MSERKPTQIVYSPDAKAMSDRVKALQEPLQMIARMKLFPDDQINRMTLAAAIHIAREALGENG